MKKPFGIALSKSQQNTPFWMREMACADIASTFGDKRPGCSAG
jgi:hypothetical protein